MDVSTLLKSCIGKHVVIYLQCANKNNSNFVVTDFEIIHLDEFIDELLHDDRVCDVILPRIQVEFCL